MHQRDGMIPASAQTRILLLIALAWTPYLESCQPLYAAQWPDEYQVGQFSFHADFPLASYHNLLNSLPQLQTQLVQMLGIQPSHERIYVFLFDKRSTYQAYLREYFPDAPTRKALFIKARGPGMVFAYRGEDFETDLRHECTHALLNAALPMVPLWLDEGLAEYFEVQPHLRSQGSPHHRSVAWSARLGRIPRIEELEALRDMSQMGRTQYRHAWAWTHFLLHGPSDAREELVRYLADIQALTPPGQLSRRLRHRIPDLERAFADHFRGW
jgi:hypothetical protein